MALRFFADHCISNQIVNALRDAGHEALRLKEYMPAESPDLAVIAKAQELGAILLSLNGDFADIVAYPPEQFGGIVALQIRDHPEITAAILNRLLLYIAAHPVSRIIDSSPSPIPLEECPWCGTKFKAVSFRLIPNSDNPEDLRVSCVNRECQFSRGVNLPIVAVDEPIYRRLPCFMIATVDKFAALPWTGPVGAFFGRVQRYDERGFYGPCDSPRGNKIPGGRLLPPISSFKTSCTLSPGRLARWSGSMKQLLMTSVRLSVMAIRCGRRSSPQRPQSVAPRPKSAPSSTGDS